MLRRKMLRDIKGNISQFITIFLMVLIGILVYTGIESYMLGMTDSASSYYENNNLQDLDCYGQFTKDDIDKIKKLDNVKDAEGKFTVLANLNTYKGHKVELNFINSNNISKMYLIKGEEFKKDKDGLWIDSYYADKAGIKIGDTLDISYNSLNIKQEVKGLINVPDHVYDTKDETELFPSHKDYGYIYLSENLITENYIKKEVMKEMKIFSEDLFSVYVPNFNYKDYLFYSSIMIDVDNSFSKSDVKSSVLNEVKNVKAVLDIKDEASYSGYQSEIEEGETYVGVFSGLFIFIALLSVVTTMTRVVRKQRVEIGTLKALGFSKVKVSYHYLSYAIFLGFLGSIVGLILGYYGLGKLFIDMEMEFYEVPNYKQGMALSSYVVAIVTILLITLVTYISTRKLLKENAADTLRPERPKVSKNSLNLVKRIKRFGFSTRWNIRDIARNKARTLMGLIGIAGCCALFTCGFGMLDSMNEYLRIELDEINNYNYKFNLASTITDKELTELKTSYGDNTSKTLNIEIKEGKNLNSNNALVDDSNGYYGVLDDDNNKINLKDSGIYVTRKLAQNEGYKVGDKIKWHIYGDDTYYESKIIGFNKDPQNQNISMTKRYYESLDLKYIPDALYTNKKVDVSKKYKGSSTVQDINAIKKGFNEMLDTMITMVYIIIFFAAVLGAVIIYNMGVLSFTEKDYQFATLKVLGFSNKKIGKVFRKQNLWITICAIIIGLPFGYFVVDYMFKYAIGDNYDFRAYIKPMTDLLSGFITLIVSIIVSYLLSLKIKKIDMVKSLKANE